MTPDIIKIEIETLAKEVFDGKANPLKAFIAFRELRSVCDEALKMIENEVLSKVYDYPKYQAEFGGFKISIMSRTNYTYNSPACENAKEYLKRVQEISKKLIKGEDAYDEFGNQILPAETTTTNFLKLEAIK